MSILAQQTSIGYGDGLYGWGGYGEGGVPPTASFTVSNTNPDSGQSISFDASGSSDPDTSIAQYEWDFGDGSTSTGQIVTHTYQIGGTFTATLTVTDTHGLQATATQQITVDDPQQSPVPSMSISPSNPQVDDIVTLDGSGSSDPDGTITSYVWNTGDGTTLSGQSVAYSYQSAGDYIVTLTVTDNDGNQSQTTQQISVAPRQPPTASFTFTPSDPFVGEDISFDASSSSDPDGTIVAYSWDFGDGSTASGPTATHAYSASGSYTVQLTVVDDQGISSSVTQSVPVETEPQGPSATMSVTPSNPVIGETVVFDGRSSTDPDGTIESYSWSFGDGASDTGDITVHTYTEPGDYTVTLEVTDNDGQSDIATMTITVTEEAVSGGGSNIGRLAILAIGGYSAYKSLT